MLSLFCCLLCAGLLCQLTIQACASLLLLDTCEYCMRQTENDTKNLDRDQSAPELSSLHT